MRNGFWVAAFYCLLACTGLAQAATDPAIALLGDQRLDTVVSDESASPCGPDPYPVPCRYDSDPEAVYSQVFGTSVRIYEHSADIPHGVTTVISAPEHSSSQEQRAIRALLPHVRLIVLREQELKAYAADLSAFPDSVHPGAFGISRIAAAVGLRRASSAPANDYIPAGLSLPPRSQRLQIAVLGTSVEREIVSSGPQPCGPIMRAVACAYEDESLLAYPNVLGHLANGTIYDLAVGGSQSAEARTYGYIPSALESQVPLIPHAADVVVLDLGLEDTSVNGLTDALLSRIDKVLYATQARAPHAIVLFLGLRNYGASVPARILAWNRYERHFAQLRNVVFVDLQSRFSPTDYADFPDGTHSNALGAQRIAQLLDSVISKLRSSR